MSSFRPTSKLVNPIGTEDVGNTLQRYLQSLRRSQPKSEMRKLARSNLHSAEALRYPFTASHEHNARNLNRLHKAVLRSPEINSLCSATRKQLHCFHPQARRAIGTAVFCYTLLELIKPARTKLIAHEGRPEFCTHAKANLQHR